MLRLGLSPAAFWSLTPAEWRWLLTAASGAGAEAMNAAALHALLQRYPDEKP